MKLYSENKYYKLYQGNMLDMLDEIELNSIDSIVTDPPYELNFMGKGWDNAGVSFQKETWKKCFDVLKPGGYLLAFGGSRTYHRIACAIEDAGFEIRDTIMWLYGSGFPKGINIGLAVDKKLGLESKVVGIKEHSKKDFREANLYASAEANKNNTKCFGYGTEVLKEAQNKWAGWNTALKPSFEPIIVARKPFDGTLIDNVLKYGVGGINIDECRVSTNDTLTHGGNLVTSAGDTRTGKALGMFQNGTQNTFEQSPLGRYPANTILTYDETDYEEVCSGFPYTKNSGAPLTMPDLRDVGKKSKESIGIDKLSFGQVSNAKRKPYVYAGREYNNKDTSMFNGDKPQAPSNYADEGSAARYFYCAKASKRDRDEGLDEFEEKRKAGYGYDKGYMNAGEGMFKERQTLKKNTHPTVKPTSLMQYLVRLVTPKGGTVLDPFNGSGSTGKAVMYENNDRNADYKYVGIELTEDYLPIAKARIEYAISDASIPIDNKVVEKTPTATKQKVESVSLW